MLINDCNTLYHTVSDHSTKASIEVTRENVIVVNETLEILVENIVTSDVYLKNFLISIGEGRADFVDSEINKHAYYEDFNSISRSNNQAYWGKNVSVAIPNVDYEPIKKIIKFMPGEVTKKIFINILGDSNKHSTDSLKIFTIQLKPLNPPRNAATANLSQCSYVNPDFVNIVIEQSFDKSNLSNLYALN